MRVCTNAVSILENNFYSSVIVFSVKLLNSKKLMEETVKAKNITPIFNRMAYGLFILLSIYFAVFSKNYPSAISNFGIALVFDPFDQTVRFPDRPLYQKVWLITHACLALIGFVLMLVL